MNSIKNNTKHTASKVSRRDFMAGAVSAAVSLAAIGQTARSVYAAGSDTIRVGLIGCGGRGTGATIDCLKSSQGVVLTAMGDAFKDRISASVGEIRKKMQEYKLADDRFKVTKETSFVGLDAYKQVIAADIDMVILATPPHFRPMHLKAAIEAGKHVFMEKPVAVDPVGIRSVIASSDLAEQKKLAIVAGTQRRHQAHYLEIMKRIQNGDIGKVVAAQCYWNQGGLWVKDRQPEWSDMEWQCRNWLYFTWLSGDHIVEQHVHNLDVVNWAVGTHPVQCLGMGGRQVRTDPKYGNIFDHFAVEYEYPDGVRVLSMCRQMEGCSNRVSEHIVGTNGSVYIDDANVSITGPNAYKYDGPNPNPYEVEHADLIASIRAGKPLNEGKRVAESTMTAIMGRMSAYTGRELKWDWAMNVSKLDLTPPKYEFGELPVEPVSVPGKTPLV